MIMDGSENGSSKWFNIVCGSVFSSNRFQGHGAWDKPWFVMENHSRLNQNRSFWPVFGEDKTRFAALYSRFQ